MNGKMPSPNDLLDVSEKRFVLHPIKFPDIFEMGKKAIASFWQVEELDFNNDVIEFQRMSEDEKHFVLQILAFFASADGIVIENLVENFCGEVQFPKPDTFTATKPSTSRSTRRHTLDCFRCTQEIM